ncbi:MAG: hypothetical protein B7C24_00995 [Bacteroidetes bacterium 4572_77]|nr:MAG: hypothetical protein B7C24_00995 [Bacteroidetes bacterium 4572_77]
MTPQKKSQMAIITLTTDWGIKDHYLASVKGAILQQIPEATIIDISHEIAPFNLSQASYILQSAYPNFPKGSIHLIGINSEASVEYPHIIIKHKDQFFIGADNGLFSLLFKETPKEIYELDILQSSNRFTFSTKDVFVNAAKHIAQGKAIEEIGEPLNNLTNRVPFQPVVEENIIKGKVIYIDRHENIVTNISEQLFYEIIKKKRFKIYLRAGKYIIDTIYTSYSDVGEGDLLALFDSNNYLEIAQSYGRAAGLLGLSLDDVVRIEID